MTEQEWLVSSDPEAMYAFVKDQVTERQAEAFVHACTDPAMFVKDSDWRTLAARYAKSGSRPDRAALLREIIGNPFVKHYRDKEGLWIDRGMSKDGAHRWEAVDWLTWNNATVPNLIRSMMEEKCRNCTTVRDSEYGRRHGLVGCRNCNHCAGAGYVTRAEPRWEDMPIIADALEAVGCAEAAILDHLRGSEPCPHCKGSGGGVIIHGGPYSPIERNKRYVVGHIAKRCSYCNGTGKRPVRHVKGCWCVDLLKGAMQ